MFDQWYDNTKRFIDNGGTARLGNYTVLLEKSTNLYHLGKIVKHEKTDIWTEDIREPYESMAECLKDGISVLKSEERSNPRKRSKFMSGIRKIVDYISKGVIWRRYQTIDIEKFLEEKVRQEKWQLAMSQGKE